MEKEKEFKKYIINNAVNGKINFKVKKEKAIKSNYLIKYFYYDINDTKKFVFHDDNIVPEKVSSHNDNVDYKIHFKNMEVKSNSQFENGTYFFITGTLYTINDSSTSDSNYILNKKDSPYVDKTINFYSSKNQSDWTLKFKDIPMIDNDNYIYDLQLQIHAIHLDNFLNEEYLLYKAKVPLKELKKEKESGLTWLWIILSIVGAIILVLVLFFIIKFSRLKKKNDSLQQEMKSLLFSNDIQKNVLTKERELSISVSDFDVTFV